MQGAEGVLRQFDPLAAMIGGYEITQVVSAFVDVGAAEALGESAMKSDELAAELDLDGDALDRLLRALVMIRIVRQGPDGRYRLTRRGERLRPGAPSSLEPLASAPAQRWWWASWGRLADSIRSGRTAFEEEHGQSLYSFLSDDEEAARAYAEYMSAFRTGELEYVVEEVDFSTARLVVDVGGGSGALLEAVLARHSHLEGVLLETPAVVSAARERIVAAGLAERVRVVAGDFLADVPSGGDVYVVRHVVHDWDDDGALRLLGRVRAAIPSDGKLVLVQHVLSDESPSRPASLVDIALLVLTGGRERSLDEYRTLLESTGFMLARAQASPSGFAVIEATPVDRQTPRRAP